MNQDILEHIERCKNGDTEAFTFLVDEFKNMVYTVCYRILNNVEEAEDVAQNTFVKAFQNLHSFSGRSKFSTWLYTIAYRSAISASRNLHFDTVNEEYLLETKEESSLSAIGELEKLDRRNYIRQAISELTEIDGVVITLFYIEESSIEEIGAITGLTEANIKVRLFRARQKLKQSLKTLLKDEVNSMRP